MKNIKQSIGKNIRHFRKLRNMTQFALAEKVNKSEETISNIERGIPATSIELLEDIAYALEVNIHQLIDRRFSNTKSKESEILKEITTLLHESSDTFLTHLLGLLKEHPNNIQ